MAAIYTPMVWHPSYCGLADDSFSIRTTARYTARVREWPQNKHSSINKFSGSSRQLTLKKGAPGDQVLDLRLMQLASYLEGGPLMWMMHLHIYQNSDNE